MNRHRLLNGNKMKVIVHKAGMKTLLSCLVVADNIEDALLIINYGHPGHDFTKENIIVSEPIKSYKQEELF